MHVMSVSEDRGRLCSLTPVGVDNLGEFLPLERSAMQASPPTQLVTLQGRGRVERTGGIPVFSVCHWVWTTPHRLPEPQVSGDNLAPRVPTVKVICGTMSPYLRPAEWSSTHRELSGQGPSDSETPPALNWGPFPQPQWTINLVRKRTGLQRTPLSLLDSSLEPYSPCPFARVRGPTAAQTCLSHEKALSQGGVRGPCGVGTRAASTLNAVRSRGTELRGLSGQRD